jgi:hypothetical protein
VSAPTDIGEDAGEFDEACARVVARWDQDQVGDAAVLERCYAGCGGGGIADHGELVDPCVGKLIGELLARAGLLPQGGEFPCEGQRLYMRRPVGVTDPAQS